MDTPIQLSDYTMIPHQADQERVNVINRRH